MKRVFALSLSVLLFGCGETLTQPDMDVQPSFAAGDNAVDAASGRLVFDGEVPGEQGVFSVHARGLSDGARGSVTIRMPDGSRLKYDVVGLEVGVNELAGTGVAWIRTSDGMLFKVYQELHEKFFTPVYRWEWNMDGCSVEICVPHGTGYYGASKGKVNLTDRVTQETLP